MQIKILVAGRYNGKELKACYREVGELLETGEGYGQSLIESGYAERAEGLTTQTHSVDDAPQVEAKPAKPYDFTQIKGISAEISEALHDKGIMTLDDFKAAIEAGQVIDVPGIGLKKLAAIKKQLGI